MRLLINAFVANNSLFSGNFESRYLRHNIELKKNTYFYVGQIIALSGT